MTETLGRFGHHPDPGTDFTVEAEVLEGMAYDVGVGNGKRIPLLARLDRALTFSVGEDEIARKAKLALYEMRDRLTLGRNADGEHDELAKAAGEAYRACMSAWAAGEPKHKVIAMVDAVDDLGILLGEPGAGAGRYEAPPFVQEANLG